jgi:hypothetical protein
MKLSFQPIPWLSLGLFKEPPREKITLENEKTLSHIPNDLWLTIFNLLDTRTLIKLLVTCKKFADLINSDENIKNELDLTHKFHLERNKFFNSFSNIMSLDKPHHQIQLQARKTETYNDNPPNRGFVMK